jgi:drug/metabolite transporter (DMT)-like permease
MAPSVWLAVLGAGFFGFIGQLMLTRGFQLEKAGIAAVMRNLDVVFVFIWDLTLLGERISLWSVAGAAIICGCAILIARRRLQS